MAKAYEYPMLQKAKNINTARIKKEVFDDDTKVQPRVPTRNNLNPILSPK